MEKIKNISYLKELETSLKTSKDDLQAIDETTHNAYKNAVITRDASEKLKENKKAYLGKASAYYESLSQMSEKAAEVKLISQKASKVAGISATYEETAAKDLATAARSIEAAMESLAILSSDAASINAKASTEDPAPKISEKAQEAYEMGLEAAEAAEKATMSSLQATIAAAKSNAKFINDLITEFSTNITNLDAAITTTMQNAKATMDTAATEYQAALETANADELNVIIAEINYKSAQEVYKDNGNKLKLAEAQKTGKDDKKTDTSKK